MRSRNHLFLIMTLSGTLLSCRRENDVQPGPSMIELAVPANFPSPSLMADNPLSKEGVELGRHLFYDKRLSGNNAISCATCHRQDISFSDGQTLTTLGFTGRPLTRHTPALINLAWMDKGVFWDGGATNLESQAFGPLTSHEEMNVSLQELVWKLNQDTWYRQAFKKVFKDTIRTGYIVQAIAQFERTLVSGNARYDKYIRKEPGGFLTDEEKKGHTLVQQFCQRCHVGDLFTDNAFHNNGLDLSFTNDTLEGLFQGRYRITHDPRDLGRYKTPTLRNTLLTAPYMHDGRFSTLLQVLDHYSEGIKISASTDVQPIPLSKDEKNAIVSFIKTLTDTAYFTDKTYSSPFN